MTDVITETAPDTDASRRAELQAALDAEYERQVTWRVEVARYAHKMRVYCGSSGPCSSGTNDWLDNRGVPRIHDYNDPFDEVGIRSQVTRFRLLKPSLDTSSTPSTIWEHTCSAFRAQGEEWRADMIRRMQQSEIDGYNIPRDLRHELIAILQSDSPATVPAVVQTMRVRVITRHDFLVPLTSFPSDFSKTQRETAAKETAAATVEAALSHLRLQHDATLASSEVKGSIPRLFRS